MPVRDLDDHPGDEEAGDDPEPEPGAERLEAAAQPLRQRGEHDAEHDEVRQIGVDRGRAEADGDAGLVAHVQEEDRDRRCEHDRAPRHASVRKGGQGDGHYTGLA